MFEAVEVIRNVVFPTSVSEEALLAPIDSYKMWDKYGGATAAWQLLLEVKAEVSGEKSYCCRLCPKPRRPAYKYSHDSICHFKRDHFGFAVSGIYW